MQGLQGPCESSLFEAHTDLAAGAVVPHMG